MRTKPFRPLLLIFVIMNALLIVFRKQLEAKGLQSDVLIGGNLLLFAVTAITLYLSLRSLQNKNPNAFVRAVMTGMITKLLLIAGSVFVYLSLSGNTISQTTLFALMALYLVYITTEVRLLTRSLRPTTHA